MRKYELMCILNPSLGEENTTTLLREIEAELKAE